MAEDKKPKKSSVQKNDKVFDVAHPSKTTVSSTSRPVIVGHKNIIKNDPMVSAVEVKTPADTDDKTSTEVVDKAAEPEKLAEKPKRELKLEPPTIESTEKPEETEVAEADELPAETEAVQEQVVPDTEPEPETEAEEKAIVDEPTEEKESSNEGEGTINAVVEGISTKKERVEEDTKQAKINEEIQGIINSKKYNVKIHAPAKTRKIRWLVVLVVVAIAAAVAWYLTLGPGKDLWINSPAPVTQPVASVPTQAPKADEAQPESKTKTFKDEELGVSFVYPEDWKVATEAVDEGSELSKIVITAPVEKVKSAELEDAESVEAEVFLRTKITVGKDGLIGTLDVRNLLSTCSSEDIIIGKDNLKLIFSASTTPEPTITRVQLSPENCQPAGEQAQEVTDYRIRFSSAKNTYLISSELIFSEEYLKKSGTTEPEDISTAQESGVVVTKDTFKKTTSYAQLLDLLKSIKEL